MDFLKTIKNFFKKRKKPDTFSDQIRREKQQKYLFRAEDEDSYVSSRKSKKSSFIGQKTRKNNENPFYSGFFQRSLDKIVGARDYRYIMGAVSFLLFVLISYILVFSPYFRIGASKILIEPLNQGIDTNLVARAAEVSHGKNIFTFNEKELALSIKENLQNTESITIDRLMPNGLKILIKSLPINFDATIYGMEDKRFGVSSNGVLIPLADIKDANFSRHLVFISEDLRTELFPSYKKVITDREMLIIAKIFDLFEKEWADLKIAKANYFFVEKELHIVLESNAKIIFALQSEQLIIGADLSRNLLSQLVTLQTYISKNRAKIIDGSVSYLDARISGKIFECNDVNICSKNLVDIYGVVYE